MNKHTLLFLVCAFSFLSSCQTRQSVYELREEANYAQETGGIFAVDLLEPEGKSYMMGGWSTVRMDRTRLGVYPISRIKIPVFTNEPLYLFFKCEPFVKDQIPAEGFRFCINNKNFAQVDLEPYIENQMKIYLPPETLELGDNILQIHHVLDEETEGKINQEKKKRIRTAVFNEMILSSHSDYDLTQRFIETKRLIGFNHRDILIQKVPSTLDYYIELSDNVRFEAKYEFVPAYSMDKQTQISMKISLKEEKRDDEIIHKASLGKDQTRGKVRIDIPIKNEISRLRLKAGEEEGHDSFVGVLIWKKASVVMKPEKAAGKAKMSAEFLNWKQSLADKNIVLIILDSARADHFSSYGYSRLTTPNLDKFAENAVLFTHVFSEALTTRCSIGTLFTGFPVTVHSLYSIGSQIPNELTTLAQMFQQEKIKTTAFVGIGNIDSSFGFNRGFDQYFELYREKGFHRKSQQYLPYLIPWLESNKENRFFLYIHFKEPHAVYIPMPPFKGLFSDAYKEKIDLSAHLNHLAGDMTEGQIEYVRACYDENLASVDSVTGEILEKMRQLDLLEESIVIVTADHGELLGEEDKVFGHGGNFREEGIHIPLLIRFPKSDDVQFPDRVDALVKSSDLFVTLADIHQFDIARDLLCGKSLLPLIQNPEKEICSYMVVEKRGTPGYCYRTKQHKLIFWMWNALIKFYDLEKDPDAMHNVYEQNKIKAHFYLSKLKKWIISRKLIKNALLREGPLKLEGDGKKIDQKILENLKALGYIK